MKKFKNLISEIQQPLSQGEKNFKDMHGDLPAAIEKARKLVPGITDQDVLFNGRPRRLDQPNASIEDIKKSIDNYDKGLKVGPNPEKTMSEELEKETIKHPVGQRPKGIGWVLKQAGEQTGKDHSVWERKVRRIGKVNEATMAGIDSAAFANKYRENEENNDHSENVKLLAKHFGTEADYKKAVDIHNKHMKIGHLPKDLGKLRHTLYTKLIKYAQPHLDMVKKETNEAVDQTNLGGGKGPIGGRYGMPAGTTETNPDVTQTIKAAKQKDRDKKITQANRLTTRNIIGEKTLTPAEIKKREEIAKSMERDNPGMPMDKKMAIATATAKRVAEADTFAKDNKTTQHKDYTDKNAKTANMRTAEVKTMVTHDCAKHIAHEEWGFGTCIPGEHTIVETSQGEGYVTHYDIMFEHGIEYDVPVEDIKVIMSETHGHAPRKTMQEEAEMDYEGEMARSELNAICDKSRKLADMMSDDMQLEAWLQSKITKAKYMIDSVYDYLMYSDKQSGMKSPMPSADVSSYAQTPAMAANYSSFLNKMAEEKILSAKQKVIAALAGDPEEIDADDFKKLRSSKKGSDTEETTAHRKKIISKTVEEAVDDEEKEDKQSGASLNPITRLNAAHQLLRGKIGIKHPIKFDDGKHELDINTVRKALDLHGNAKTAAEKEKIQNAFKTHAGLLKALEGEFAAEKKPISLGGTIRVGGIKPIKEYADPVTGRMDPFTGRGDFQLILTRGPDGKPFFRKAPTGEIGIGKKTAAIKDTSVSEGKEPILSKANMQQDSLDRLNAMSPQASKMKIKLPPTQGNETIGGEEEVYPNIATEETMLNNLYHTLSQDNKSTFMEKLRTEDGLTELLQFAQEQGL
jgi:hypothetical protein